MLFKAEMLQRIAIGEVDLAFRRWSRPTVTAGGRLRTSVGELALGSVDVVEAGRITTGEARRAGFASVAALHQALSKGSGSLYRIELRALRPDGRTILREDTDLGEGDYGAIVRRLDRWDGSRGHGYGIALLRAIAVAEGIAAQALARRLETEKAILKRDIRVLKEMGLTESLAVGYRLSPRGRTFLATMAEERQ